MHSMADMRYREYRSPVTQAGLSPELCLLTGNSRADKVRRGLKASDLSCRKLTTQAVP